MNFIFIVYLIEIKGHKLIFSFEGILWNNFVYKKNYYVKVSLKYHFHDQRRSFNRIQNLIM